MVPVETMFTWFVSSDAVGTIILLIVTNFQMRDYQTYVDCVACNSIQTIHPESANYFLHTTQGCASTIPLSQHKKLV